MCHKQIKITTYDRLLRSWENSMEMVRDFQNYADITDDNEAARQTFYEFAETACEQASRLRDLLLEYNNPIKKI